MYNRNLYFKLLKQKFSNLDSEEIASQVSNYSSLVEAQLDWDCREKYLELFEKFQNNQVEIGKFCGDFNEIGLINVDIVDSLEANFILLSVDDRSIGFGEIIGTVYELCYDYLENRDINDFNSEIEYQKDFEKMYGEIKNYLERIV